MTTLPNLSPCTKPDCRAPIAHRHILDGGVFACRFALHGEPCLHDNQDLHCHAPRETAPLHLPDVDAVAQAIYESDNGVHEWDNQDRCFKDAYRHNARAVLDLIAAHQPVWVRVEPGTRIEAGQRCRVEYWDGDATEYASAVWWTARDSTTTYVLHTPPEPEDPRVEVLAEEMEAEWPHCGHEWPCAGAERFRGAARRAIARLDEIGGGGK